MVAEWANESIQIQVGSLRRSQIQIPPGARWKNKKLSQSILQTYKNENQPK